MLRCFVQRPTDINMKHREATGQRQNQCRTRRRRSLVATRLRTVVTCNR
jgi:hypothetical protein